LLGVVLITLITARGGLAYGGGVKQIKIIQSALYS
jgi:hypothetical protein